MGQCIIRRTGAFKAFINVTATPNCTVTVTLGSATQTATAASNGLASFTVKKKGTYTITSDASGSQTANVSITVNKQTYTANIVGRFTLALTPQTINGIAATTVSANRSSSQYAGASTGALTSGAYIYYGDVITLTGAVTSSTIYNAVTFQVNGSNFTSGGTHTVTGNVTAAATTSVKSYTMTITKTAGVNITITKTGSQYAGNGVNSTWTAAGTATVYYGDVLDVAFSNANTTVYASVACTVAGTARSSGYDHTVTANFTIAATHTVKSFTMTITKTAGVNLTVTKTSSPYQGAGVNSKWTAAGTATVYYGDVFDVAFSNANTTIYASVACTVAGTARSSGYDHTATAAFTIAATHTVKSFTITYSKGSNTSLTLQRMTSPYGGATCTSYTASFTGYYGDTVKVTASASTNYNLTLKWGSTAISSGSTQTATAAVTVSSTATIQTRTFKLCNSSSNYGSNYQQFTVNAGTTWSGWYGSGKAIDMGDGTAPLRWGTAMTGTTTSLSGYACTKFISSNNERTYWYIIRKIDGTSYGTKQGKDAAITAGDYSAKGSSNTSL